MWTREAQSRGGKSKSMKKIKSSIRKLRNARMIFEKKYPGKTIWDFAPKNPNRINES